MFAKRLEIGRLLILGKSYESIQKQLKVTPTTIAKINNILEEKGEGLRKSHKQLLLMENKLLEKQKERQKNLENPFRKSLKPKTLLGALLKGGIKSLDKKINKNIKQNTAKNDLQI